MIRVDYHTHTNFSDGQASVQELLHAAERAGLDEVVISDHFDVMDYRPAIANLTSEQLLVHFTKIRELSTRGKLRVLCGIETQPGTRGLKLNPKIEESCDVIITSCHYVPFCGRLEPGEYENDEYWQAYKETMLQIARSRGHILGHSEEYLPIEPLIKGQSTNYQNRRDICKAIANMYLDKRYIVQLTDALLDSGKACELHCATQSPREWVISYMADRGVAFSVGSDAHSEKSVGQVDWAYEMLHNTKARLYRLPKGDCQ